MIPEKKKKRIRNISIGLIGMLLAGYLFGGQRKVVWAKDVFLEVQKIRNEVINTPDEDFTIVEIVDKKGNYQMQSEGENLTYEIQPGEEDMGYLIGGQEPFAELYLDLWTLSRSLSGISFIEEETANIREPEISAKQETIKQIYEELLSKIDRKITDNSADINATPLKKTEIKSYFPSMEGFESCLRFVEKVSDADATSPITEGWLVEDDNGAYIWNQEKGEFIFVGEQGKLSAIWYDDSKKDSLSDNNMEEESVSDNDIGEETEEEAGFGNDIREDENSDEEADTGEKVEDSDREEELPSENGSESSQEENEEGNSSNEPENSVEDNQNEINVWESETKQEPENGEEKESVFEEKNVESANEIPEVSKVTTEGFMVETVGFGKQVQAMSGVTPVKRYSFYAQETDIPSEISSTKEKVKVSTMDSSTEGTKKIAAIYEFTFQGIENQEWFKQNVFGLEKQSGEEAASYESMAIEVIACELKDENLKAVMERADLVYWNADMQYIENAAEVPVSDITEEEFISLVTELTENKSVPKIITARAYQKIAESSEIWNQGHFVKDNLYVINHELSSTEEKERLFREIEAEENATQQEKEALAEAFAEVAYRVEQEEYERQQLGITTWSDSAITPALAIQTILTYSEAPAVIEKSRLKVLELQPCYSFKYAAGEEGEKEFKEKFLPQGKDSTVEVEIVGMTTAEFCGKLEDINVEYDMIYLGSNTERMNRMEIGEGEYCTVYNDFNMYGIVYSHIGDLCHIGAHAGLLAGDRDYNTYRYSGNDILEEQKEEFLEFLKSGAPIVVEENFFIKNDVGEITKLSTGKLLKNGQEVTVRDEAKGVDGICRQGILDSSSYLYQFLKEACANEQIAYGKEGWKWENRIYKNLVSGDEVDINSFSKWLNQPKMAIHMLSQPVEYNYTTKNVETKNGTASVIADSSYLQKEAGMYYLTYEFYLSNVASVDIQNTHYKVSLFIDANMDGRFSGNSENLSDSQLKVTNLDTGEETARDRLKTGVHYKVQRALPYEAVGAVCWKLVVEQENNPALRSAVTGMTAVRREEKQTIKVLQLYEEKNNVQGNIQKYMEEEKNLWSVLLKNLPDFEVEVTSIEAKQYLTGKQAVELNNYDMLIVGFADSYQIRTEGQKEEALAAIIEYADSGKCVLFSHDNTNWYNGKGENLKLNMMIRDLTGLDRYGVTLYRTTDSDKYEKNIIKNGKEVSADSKEALETMIFEALGQEYKRDIAFAINSEQTKMDSRTQGLTYSGNEHDRYSSNTVSDVILFQGKKYGDYYRYLNFENVSKDTWKTDKSGYEVGKVNQGAITEYPYRLNDTISIAPTHGQYYQLDLDSDADGDGEGDIVVWYTINNSIAGEKNDIYDYSPNDVRNNYYIYNRGNITYTGMGHKTIENEEEIKLFINTMVAAYRVSIQSPQISIIQGNGDDTKKNFDTVAVDMNVTGQEENLNYHAYFKIEDQNMVSEEGKEIRVKLYLGGGSNSCIINGETVTVTEKTKDKDWKVYEGLTKNLVTPNEAGYYLLKAGQEYYVQVPLMEYDEEEKTANLSQLKSLNLYLEAQTLISKRRTVKESAFAYDCLTLTQLNLFDLD